MSVLICDPGFTWAAGHHLSLNRALLGGFRRNGIETHLLTHRGLDAKLVSELDATPVFENHPATNHSNDPLCNWMENLFWNAEMLAKTLSRIVTGPGDVMLWHSTCHSQLLAVAKFLESLKP
ncbi:MAG: hypothetical protein P4M00_02040 [Azospirillaceae bacterium]|nr:hypothetical protein [Azospirillaceae bacterium]